MSWSRLVQHYDSLPSTMLEARALAHGGALEGTTVVAQSQTQGRGRRGRTWFSPPGAGLWLTTILRPTVAAERLATLSLVVGVATCETLRRVGASTAQLKWPNDVVVGSRKLAGLLLEHEGGGRGASVVSETAGNNASVDGRGTPSVVLVGIGVNLAAAGSLALPEDLRERYIGLADLTPSADPDVLLTDLLDALRREVEHWQTHGPEAALARFATLDALAGLDVRAEVGGHAVVGRAQGVAPDGTLRLFTDAGWVHVHAGEVERVRPEGSSR